MTPGPHLTGLLAIAHERTQHIASKADAAQLFEDGARAAERMPEPLGSAIAAVLAMAAYERRLSPIRGSLGASKTSMALALAALEYLPTAQDG